MNNSTPTSRGPLAFLARNSDLSLAIAVSLMVTIMVLPVSTGVLDTLLAINISTSVVLLMVALYAADGVRLPSFPTVLLLSTLFRLALNVSSTRLILLNGDAGQIIHAFGNFVVGGNLVVGAIVFLVLVLIQFIVIAKGSERVAEVAARFMLDAMPGKQMSIDADVRSGLIDEAQARERRSLLERESKLYGAMDGAMKFVKGDAIAGILISLVNIIGGLIIGVVQQQLPLGLAAQRYTLLTIGDGLVSQIPALLVSISAGLVVTRVASSQGAGGGRLARDMLDQVLENPRALLVAAVLMLGLAASSGSTGFPWPPFLVLGLGAGLGAIVRLRRMAADTPKQEDNAGGDTDQKQSAPAFADVVLALELHPTLQQRFGAADPELRATLQARVEKVIDDICKRYGVPRPSRGFFAAQRPLLADGYRISLHGGTVASGTLPPDKVYVRVDLQRAQQLELDATPMPDPATDWPLVVIPDTEAERASAEQHVVMDALDMMLRHLSAALERHLSELVGLPELASIVEQLVEKRGEFVEAVVPRRFSLAEVTDVVQALLRERVPVRDPARLLSALATWDARERPGDRVAFARRELARTICGELCDDELILRCYTMTDEVEEWVRTTGGLPAPDDANELRRLIAAAIDPARHRGGRPVLVVEEDIRTVTAQILAPTLPEVAVLAPIEIPPEVQWDRVAKIEREARAA